MSGANGVNDDDIEIDPQQSGETAAASDNTSGPVTSPEAPPDVDQQTSAELASSPTAQGGGPNPDQTAQAPQGVASTSQSASLKGVPGGPTAVKDIFAQHEAAAAQDNAIDSANTDARLAKYSTDNAAVGRAMQGEVAAAKVYGDEDTRLHGLIAAEAQRQGAAEQKAQQNWSVERTERLRDYQQQLTAVQQLAMQSGSPFVGMGKGAYLGLAGAEFAQGFLATRGVKIDVSGQIDKWVDQSIQEHQFQVNTMEKGAEASLHLYDVARQSSMDDTEARARYGGMVVAGLQAQVQANANMYQSKLAVTQSQVVQAQLKIKGDEYSDTVINAYQARAEGRLRAEQNAAYRQSEMSIQEFRAQQAAKVAAARASAVAPPSQLMAFTDPNDTRKDGGNKGGERAYFAVDPKAVGETAMTTMRGASAGYRTAIGLLNDMRSQIPAAGVNSYAPAWLKNAESPEYQAFKNTGIELITQIEQAAGGKREVASTTAAKRFDQLIQQQDLSHWGNRGAVLDKLGGELTKSYENTMTSNNAIRIKGANPGTLQVHGINVDEQGYAPSTSDFGASQKATAADAFNPPPPPTSTQHAVSTIVSRQATDSPSALTVDGARDAFLRAGRGEEPDVEASPTFTKFLTSIGHEPTTWVAANGYRNEYKAVDTLVLNAKAGDADAERALERLTASDKFSADNPHAATAGYLAGPGGEHIHATQEVIDYARYAVKHIDKDESDFLPEKLTLNKTQQQIANQRIYQAGPRNTYDPGEDSEGRAATATPKAVSTP